MLALFGRGDRKLAGRTVKWRTKPVAANDYVSAERHKGKAVIPDPAPTHLVVTRREYIVHRRSVSPAEFGLLTALVGGQTIGGAIEDVASVAGANRATLANQLQHWFQKWAAAEYFRCFEMPN